MGHKKCPTAVILIILYCISLLLPYSLGAHPILPIDDVSPSANTATAGASGGSDATSSTSAATTTTTTTDKESMSDASEEKRRTDAKYLYFDFPDEGPESAALADILSRLALRSIFNPLVRPATILELIDLLTVSMWSTMSIVGSLVFGIGFVVIAWRVYWSVYEASRSEPVSLTFLFSIPGLRYLQNHIRYHLFETPLQPRRRFASFVGAGMYNVDLDDLDEHHVNARSISRRRRESSVSTMRNDIRVDASSAGSNGSASSIFSGPTSAAAAGTNQQKSRRKSMMRPTQESMSSRSNVIVSSAASPDLLRKRHSLSPKQEIHLSNHIQPSSIEVAPSRSSVIERIVEEEQRDNHGSAGIISSVPKVRIDSDGSVSSLATLSHRSSSVDIEAMLGEISDGEASVPIPSATAPLAMPRPVKLITPESSPPRAEQFKGRNDPVVLERKVTGYSDVVPCESKSTTFLVSPPTNQSKLFRRLNTANNNGNAQADAGYRAEQSKLSRYFTQEQQSAITITASKTSPIAARMGKSPTVLPTIDDPYSERLHEGDLTPPPGFNRRHSSQGVFNAVDPNRSTNYQTRPFPSPVAPQTTTSHASSQYYHDVGPYSSLRQAEEADDDTVMPSGSYYAAFLNASQRRRTSVTVSPIKSVASSRSTEKETPQSMPWEHRQRIQSEADTSSSQQLGKDGLLPQPADELNFSNWRWFLGDDGRQKEDLITGRTPVWTSSNNGIPVRPHSALGDMSAGAALRSKLVIPVGSGTNSTGRVTPEGASTISINDDKDIFTTHHQAGHRINLGIFDDLFTRS